MSVKESIDIEDLVLDDRLQFRLGNGPYGTDRETIERYSEAMADGAEFPDVGVIELSEGFEEYEMATLLVYRGFHRICAARALGKGIVDCEVRPGTWNDARCLAFKENTTHGKPRTAKELARVLEAIDKDYPNLSVRQLAAMAGCSHGSVQRWKKPEAASSKKVTPPPPPPPPPSQEPVDDKEPEDWDEEDVVTLPEQSEEQVDDEPEANDPPQDSESEEPEEEESVDPYAIVKHARQEADELVSILRNVLKRVERMKQGQGGARIKYGVVEKAIEEARRHLDQFAPSIIVPSEVIESLGKDPTDGQGWLHKLGGSRLDPDILAKCQKV
jgi:hypothetical protein